ncbi:MAG: META domain-containing protein [Gemmatimonadota bacterium]
MQLEGPEWVVEDLAGRGIIDRSRMTLEFGDGRVAGLASCNRYSAEWTSSGPGRMEVGGVVATMRACAPSLMNQERHFLELLERLEAFRFDETGALLLRTSRGEVILARRP